jgi:hypothetical protein
MSNTDPSFMAELDAEAEYARKGSLISRLTIERGEGAVVRFLPVQMGTAHTWFGRVGRHWFNKKMIGCPRTTSPHMGGDMEADCPVCALAEALMAEGDKALHDQGKKLAVWPQYLTYVLELERIDKRGDSEPVKARDAYTPQIFWLTKIAFIELERLVKKSLAASPQLGLLDPILGNDVEVRRDAKGTWRLDLMAPQPIRNDLSDDDLVAWVNDLCSSIKQENTRPAGYEELEKYAQHVEKQLENVEEAPRGRGRFEEEESEQPAPRRRLAAAAPAAAIAPRGALRSLRAPAAAAPAPSQVERELDAVPEGEAPAAEVRRAPTPAPQPAPRPAPRPAVRQSGVISEPPAGRRPTPATPPPEASMNEDPSDEVPPETRDPAPPIAQEPPPTPPASAPRPQTPRRLSAALTRTLSRGV